MDTALWNELARWKAEYRWVDLSFELSPDTPHWHGFDPLGVKALYTFEGTGNVFQSFQYTIPGQYGTHTDFPRHFDPKGRFAHEFGVQDMAYPLAVIDKSAAVAADADYRLTKRDVLDWEAAYGRVPAGAFVAFRSDWSKRAAAAYDNSDADGNAHYPGWDLGALKYLLDERGAAAIGHETPDTDSAAGAADSGMICEDFVLKRGRLNVELMANLDQVPPVGAIVFVAFPNVKDGVGFNSRVFAVAPK
jgi:kynurenine formamidase